MLRNLSLLVFTLAACAGAPVSEPRTEPLRGPFDWQLGHWVGHRIDGEDGSKHPMTLDAEPILEGAGQIRWLMVDHDNGVYRGFAVQVVEPDTGIWHRRYVNAVRGRFAEQTCDRAGDVSVWRNTDPERTRESTVTSERLGRDRWRRTMRVSNDQGATWSVLWTDDLTRG